MLDLTSIEQLKKDIFNYLGPEQMTDSQDYEILRQYNNSPFPSLINRVEQLQTEQSVVVEVLEIEGTNSIVFKTM